MSSWSAERVRVLRFLVVGGANTAVTYALFVALAQVLPPQIAYTLVFALGLAFTVLVTGRWVFEARRSVAASAAYAGWYLGVYAVGLLVLAVLEQLGVQRPLLLGLGVLAVTTPLNYVGGRLVFRGHLAPPLEDPA